MLLASIARNCANGSLVVAVNSHRAQQHLWCRRRQQQQQRWR